MGRGRIWWEPVAASLSLVILAGCAARAPGLVNLSTEEWGRVLRQRGLEPAAVADPLAYTPAMRASGADLADSGSVVERLENLQRALFDKGRFPFTYETRGTLTAQEAFQQRRGNCLSFTSLFISLARSIGIEVRAAVPAYAGGGEREGDLVVVNTHVVAVYRAGDFLAIFDFDRTRQQPVVGARLIDDLRLAALHANNLGVDELREGRLEAALRYLETAVKLAPDFTDAYANLGVARRRAGDIPGAFEAYRAALLMAPRDSRILGNLATLYQTQGQQREARTALLQADIAPASPYFLMVRGDLEMTQGNVEGAIVLYRRARSLAPQLPAPLICIAQAEMARGRPRAARRALQRALKLDPGSEEARSLLGRLDGVAL